MKTKYQISIFILIIMSLMPVMFMGNITFDNTLFSYAPKESKHFLKYDKYRKKFGSDIVLVYLFELPKENGKKFLKELNDFDQTSNKYEGVKRTFSVFNLEKIEGKENELEIDQIVNPSKIDEINYLNIKERIFSTKVIRSLIVSSDEKYVALAIEPEYKATTVQRREIRDLSKRHIEDSKELKKYLVSVAGPLAVDVASFETSFIELLKFIPFTLTIGFLLLFVIFPSKGPLIISMIVINSISSFVMSFYGVFCLPFTLISSMVPTLMMALTIAFVIHLYNKIRYFLREGEAYETAISKARSVLIKPSFFTALTTCAGFLALSLNDMPPMKHFGVIAAIGTFIILITIHFILPPVLLKFTSEKSWPDEIRFVTKIDRMVFDLYKFTTKKSKVTILITGILIVLAAPFILKIKVETSLLAFFSPDSEITKQTNILQDNLSGTSNVELVFTSDVMNVKSLNKIEKLIKDIEQDPGVTKVLSPLDILKEVNSAFEGESFYTLPKSDDLLEQYLFIYDGDDLSRFYDEDSNLFRIVISTKYHRVSKLEEFIEELTEKLYISFPGVKYDISGQGEMLVEQNKVLVLGQLKSFWVSVVLIFILLLIQWRRLKDAAITLIPNLLPLYVIFVLMGIFDIWLDMGTALIASVAIGIAVDDTIHIFSTFRRFFKSNRVVAALDKTIASSGRALTATTLILSGQFLILGLSNFVPTSNFGILTSAGLITALLADIVLLPAMIRCFYDD